MSDKQPEALRLAEALESGDCLLSVEREETAAELRRQHAENADLSDQLLQSVLTISTLNDEIGRITEQSDELLEALKQLSMWPPIMTEMAGMNAEETQVEFSEFLDDPQRQPDTISIASSLAKAKAAIAKAIG